MHNLPKIILRSDHLNYFSERKTLVTKALELGILEIIMNPEDKNLYHLGRFNQIIFEGKNLMYEGERVGVLKEIDSEKDLLEAESYKNIVPYLIVQTNDWKVIPLENLITKLQGSMTKIYVCVKNFAEAKVAMEVMEVGCSGVVLMPETSEELDEFTSFDLNTYPKVILTSAKITRIKNLGLGDRVCIDTTSLLGEREGMLVGSQSNGLFLICSESFESSYVPARPFRVNAGPVHSYVLCLDGTTKYLSELASGDELLTRKPDGSLRCVNVGRVKIEVRPMIYLEAEAAGKRYSVVVQNAETIRLLTPNGAKSVSELSIGDCVCLRTENIGRHLGHQVKETILER